MIGNGALGVEDTREGELMKGIGIGKGLCDRCQTRERSRQYRILAQGGTG